MYQPQSSTILNVVAIELVRSYSVIYTNSNHVFEDTLLSGLFVPGVQQCGVSDWTLKQ